MTQRTEARPVDCTHGKGGQFLEIYPVGEKVRVQRTALGKARLNRFWPMWLRQLVLDDANPAGNFTVEVYGDSVIIGSTTAPAHLFEAVRGFAAEVSPISRVPLRRVNRRREISWKVDFAGEVDVLGELSGKLPTGASLSFWDSFRYVPDHTTGTLILRTRRSKLPNREIAMLVELHLSLLQEAHLLQNRVSSTR